MQNLLVDVRALVAQYGVRGLFEVRAQADLVGHGARREEECSLLASDLGHMGLEGEGAWLMVDVVTERGCRGVCVHLLGRDWGNIMFRCEHTVDDWGSCL